MQKNVLKGTPQMNLNIKISEEKNQLSDSILEDLESES
jgi:hypothetical protein